MSHWYDKEGKPCHWVTGKNGKERDSTLRDARKNNWCPSVTGILDIADKPALTNWLLSQAYMAMATLPELKDPVTGFILRESEDARIKRAKADAAVHANEARDKGSAIHNAIECHYKGQQVIEHREYVDEVVYQIEQKYGKQNWVSEANFAHKSGFGGMIDLSCPEIVIDYKYKSSPFDDKTKLVYDNHKGQLAAYKEGMGYEGAICANVFICETDSPTVRIVEHSQEDMDWGLDYFMACFELWKTVKKFDPAF